MIKLITALGIAALLGACSNMNTGYTSNANSARTMGSYGYSQSMSNYDLNAPN